MIGMDVEAMEAAVNADPLRHHRRYHVGGAFGQGWVARAAERVADAMGSVQFVIASTVVIVSWLLVNDVVRFLHNSWVGLLHGRGFDPAPFILLNLVFSAVAYYSASMVMIAQKAQAKRDLDREAADAHHREELAQNQMLLLARNTELTEQVHRLTREIHVLVAAPGVAPHDGEPA